MIHKNIINDFFCYFGHVGRWKNPLLSLFLLREATPPPKKKKKKKNKSDMSKFSFPLEPKFCFSFGHERPIHLQATTFWCNCSQRTFSPKRKHLKLK